MSTARPMPVAADPEPNPDSSLEYLLHCVAEGNQAAFTIVYSRVAGIVFGLAQVMLQDSRHAEEVTQEALLDVWRRARLFQPTQGSAKAWIIAIAHRQAVQRMRSLQLSQHRDLTVATKTGEHVNSKLAQDEHRSTCGEADRYTLESLSISERGTFMSAYYSGYSTDKR